MEITLSPELEAVVRNGVESGRFASVDEYVAEAVELLHEREEWFGETLEEQRASLEASFQEAERGDFMSMEEVRESMRAMKVRWMAENTRT